jgi:hypothetical protein
MGSAVCARSDNYCFRLSPAQFFKLVSLNLMAAEHQKATFPFFYRAIGENQNIPSVFLAADYYGAKGAFVYSNRGI